MTHPILARRAQSVGVAEERSFESFCREVQAGLRRYAIGKVGPDDADDLVQDTLSRAWEHRASFDPSRGSALTWVRAIARNAAVDCWRKETTSATALEQLRALHAPPPSTQTETTVLSSLSDTELRRAVAGLGADQRAALWEVYWMQRSHSEVARENAIPLGTVKSRVRLALATLRPELGATP
jgi:RNA polymerase sigma-70 factor, ECF subfamily